MNNALFGVEESLNLREQKGFLSCLRSVGLAAAGLAISWLLGLVNGWVFFTL